VPMAFAIFVELLNLAASARKRKRAAERKEAEPVRLHQQYVDDESPDPAGHAPVGIERH